MSYQDVDLSEPCDNLPTAFAKINANFVELYGGRWTPVANVRTADYTLNATDHVVHVNSTSARTMSLPAAGAAGIANKFFTIRNVNTGIVTIDPDGSEVILDPVYGSQATMKLFAQYEVVTLYSDGTSWYVVSKELRKHIARAFSTAALSVATATVTPVPMNGQQLNAGLTFTSGNDEPYAITRAGRYRMTGKPSMSLNSGVQLVAYLYRNGSVVWEDRKASGATTQITQPAVDTILDLSVGDTIGLRVWHNQGSNVSLLTGFNRPELIIQEID